MGGFCRAGDMATQLQNLHRDIGKELVEMRRSNPSLQQPIYTLLDQVGSLYRLSGKVLGKKKKLKVALNEEQDMRISFQKDNEILKAKTNNIKKSLDQESSRLTSHQQQIDDLTRERDVLLHKKVEIENKERAYLERIKVLEESKVAGSKESVSITLAENKEQESMVEEPRVSQKVSELKHI